MTFIRQSLILSALVCSAIAVSPISAQTPPDGPQDQSNRESVSDSPAAEVIMSFHVRIVAPAGEPVMMATFAASQPGVSQLRYRSRDGDAEIRGTIVFSTMAEFLTWRETQLSRYFDALGRNIEIESLKVVRPKEVARTGATNLSQIANDISITYRNSGNESEGDSDIDAVTVICGDGAECEPSN